MHCPAGRLTADQHSEIRECFHLLDADGSGELDTDEMCKACAMLGLEVGNTCNCIFFGVEGLLPGWGWRCRSLAPARGTESVRSSRCS